MSASTTISKFKFGDRVRLTGSKWAHTVAMPDEEYVVAGFRDEIQRGDGLGRAAFFLDENREPWYLDESDSSSWAASIIDEPAPTFSTELAVRQFHLDFGHPVALAPALISVKRAELRWDMLDEEMTELQDAIFDEDVIEIADALADIVWLAYGAAAEYGITLDPILQEVARSNASKLGDDGLPIIAGANDPDGFPEGKIKKGPNYQPPQIAPILEAQGWTR